MKALLFVLCLTSPLISRAQKSMTFREAERMEIFKPLDKKYPGGISADSTKSVFKNSVAYTNAYRDFLLGFGRYLKAHDFLWGKPVRCFNKVYFSRAGKVDYFLYNFKPGDLTAEQEIAFAKLLADYIQTARFPLPATSRFAQCSPVKYADF